MDEGRRRFLACAVPTALLAGATLGKVQQPTQPPPQPVHPEHEIKRQIEQDRRRDQPWGVKEAPAPRRDSRKDREEIKRKAQQLFQLAAELRREVEATDTAQVFSLQLMRKAEQIEKLAKSIKNLARP